jgi:hypothetical protein
MPGCSSWNGKWSGEGTLYARIKKFSARGSVMGDKAKMLLDKGYFSYSFGDGWRAGIDVKEVTPLDARKIKKNSSGFCGYDWMLDSIMRDGTIQTSLQRGQNG